VKGRGLILTWGTRGVKDPIARPPVGKKGVPKKRSRKKVRSGLRYKVCVEDDRDESTRGKKNKTNKNPNPVFEPSDFHDANRGKEISLKYEGGGESLGHKLHLTSRREKREEGPGDR